MYLFVYKNIFPLVIKLLNSSVRLGNQSNTIFIFQGSANVGKSAFINALLSKLYFHAILNIRTWLVCFLWLKIAVSAKYILLLYVEFLCCLCTGLCISFCFYGHSLHCAWTLSFFRCWTCPIQSITEKRKQQRTKGGHGTRVPDPWKARTKLLIPINTRTNMM